MVLVVDVVVAVLVTSFFENVLKYSKMLTRATSSSRVLVAVSTNRSSTEAFIVSAPERPDKLPEFSDVFGDLRLRRHKLGISTSRILLGSFK